MGGSSREPTSAFSHNSYGGIVEGTKLTAISVLFMCYLKTFEYRAPFTQVSDLIHNGRFDRGA